MNKSYGYGFPEPEYQYLSLTLTKQNQDRLTEENGIQSSLTEDDMKSYLQEVIKEIQNARKGNNNHDK
jgi:hypothetical protein